MDILVRQSIWSAGWKEESGFTDAKVVATGGLGNIIYKETDSIDYYDQDLTLMGLELIYEKNKKIARESV